MCDRVINDIECIRFQEIQRYLADQRNRIDHSRLDDHQQNLEIREVLLSAKITKHVPHAKGNQKSDSDIGGKRETEQGPVPNLEDVSESAVHFFRFGEIDRLGKATD